MGTAPARTPRRPTGVEDDFDEGRDAHPHGHALVGAALAGAFVLLAVVLEVVGGMGANSPVPAWAQWVFPLAWPEPVRVVWWLGVAGVAAVFRLMLSRAGVRQRRSVVVLSVAPFVVFAAGIATGAEWATWH